METSLWLWSAFGVLLVGLLAFDLVVIGRQRAAIGIRQSLLLTAGYVAIALLFGGAVWLWRGHQAGLEYLTGFLLEKSLSADNIFVFVVIFGHFQVPKEYQHRVLLWGVAGALVMRAIMIVRRGRPAQRGGLGDLRLRADRDREWRAAVDQARRGAGSGAESPAQAGAAPRAHDQGLRRPPLLRAQATARAARRRCF